MPDTYVTSWGHACVRFEKDGARLVLDPGGFSSLSVLDDADAVLITHEHADHVDAAAVVAAQGRRPELAVRAPEPVVRQLVDAGAPAERTHAVAAGDTFSAAGFGVRVVGEWHALIHQAIPRVANVAYLIDGTAFHPGDSFTEPPAGTAVGLLLTPVSAPWMKLAEAVDYVAAVRPRLVVPIHDAILSDAGKGICDRVMGNLVPDVAYRRLLPGDVATLSGQDASLT
jgi:L-ascorbate metabolism protein UlaG (beta-lactamase superfamily)